MKKVWKNISVDRVFSCPYLKVDKSRFENNFNYSDDFYSLDFGDWVHVVPVLEDQRILMIELFRFGTEKVSLEFPGGQIEKNQTAEESAKNELFEETGYESDSLHYLGWSYPNPAIQKNKCHFYVADKVRKISDQNLEPAEDISLKIVEHEELSSLVSSGEVTHSLAIIAYYNYLKYLNLKS
jgi:ADP-ribose pyrophosphatase